MATTTKRKTKRTMAAERVAAKILAEEAQASPARHKFIISREGEVCQAESDNWREDLTQRPVNHYCKGCKDTADCTTTKIAAVALCDKRRT